MEGHQYTLSGKWKTWEPLGHLGQDLAGGTLGVVGIGRIGMAMARRCRGAWNMNILYHDVNRNLDAERELQARQVPFDTLLAEADFISIHTDLNEKTRGMFSTEQFKKMKRSAVLVDTARGPIVDEKALYTARLLRAQIFAAGLDVTDPEPPAMDNPLLKLPNIVIAPHIASTTIATRNQMAEICAKNLIAGVTGQKLAAWVNPEVESKRAEFGD